MKRMYNILILLTAILGLSIFFEQTVSAHCDSVDGPLIIDAQKSLKTGDIIPTLKWVKKSDENLIKDMFEKTIKLAKESPAVKETAEMYFLETLVRIHRAGEGAPYTGIKPKGSPIDAAVVKGDKSLETGSVDDLANLLSGKIKEEIQKRFKKTVELKSKADVDVEAGRKYVEYYVDYIHFVENVHNLLKADSGQHKH